MYKAKARRKKDGQSSDISKELDASHPVLKMLRKKQQEANKSKGK